MYSQCSEAVLFMSYLNFAVSGSISSSSLTGERGTLAENFSVIGEGMKIGEVERDGIMTIQLTQPQKWQIIMNVCSHSSSLHALPINHGG